MANVDVWPAALVLVAVMGAPAKTLVETPAAVCWARGMVNVPVAAVAVNLPR
jgi:hypothetical protein